MNPKLPPEERKRRLDQRNKRTAERRKSERAEKRANKVKLSRKEAMKLAAKKQRSMIKEENAIKRLAAQAFKLTPEYQEQQEAKRLAKNARDRANYAANKGEPKKRGRKPLPKPTPKTKYVLKPLTVATPKAVGKVFKTVKQDLTQKIPLTIPELRMTVYITKDQDPAQVRAKYLKL